MMARKDARGSVKPLDMHREWLELVDSDGPFIAAPVLAQVYNNGMGSVFEQRLAAYDTFKKSYQKFFSAWDDFDKSAGTDDDRARYRGARNEWVCTVLADVLGWGSHLVSYVDAPSPYAVSSPQQSVDVLAQFALQTDAMSKPDVLVTLVPATDSLRVAPGDSWAADYIDRMDALLRHQGVSLGLVTDGRWWGLVCARPNAMTASGVVDALTWVEEPATRDAFFTLLGLRSVAGGKPEHRLEQLFVDSVAAAEEVTEALGAQVRRAVELLIQAFSEADSLAKARGETTVLPENPSEAYEAAVTVMMRVVFLLFAEERGLLPTGILFEQGYGIAGELERLRARKAQESEEALDATSLTWHRLLATSRALYEGTSFENMRMPAYGGSLFDPQRFDFLTATSESGTLRLTVSDRVLLHVLESVQVAVIKREARRISFRDIDVEQIGYIYEGLLGYTVGFTESITLGLGGKEGEEPEVTLDQIEALAARVPTSDAKAFAAALIELVKEDQPSCKPQTVSQVAKLLGQTSAASAISALSQLVGKDSEEFRRIEPWLPLVRMDLRQRPFIVPAGGLIVKETPSRKNAGAHYTPKSLAEEVVTHALEPLCYSPGPYQTNNRDEFVLKSPGDILRLRVADIACGSGAFLVAAARYLADRLVEAWLVENPDWAGRKDLKSRALREVVARCLYGADINEMAVEMCKLSLWLVSLDPKLPFSFVDDKIFVGNSLLGVTDLKQIGRSHIDVSVERESLELGLPMDSVVDQAVKLRQDLANQVDENDPMRSTAYKKRLLAQYRELTAQLSKIADGVVAAGLPLGGKPGKKLDEAYENLRVALSLAYPADGSAGSSDMLDSIIDRGLTPTVATDYERWQPLHWVLAAPDIFVENGGFDAVIGNPPFLGNRKITGAMGENLRDWLINILAYGQKGGADLVAYFFLRSQKLLNLHGSLGFIATNTLAQGDTREVGLVQMTERGFTIARAVQSRKWPASSANLEYAAVWGTVDVLSPDIHRFVEDTPVTKISTLLEPAGTAEGDPLPLEENDDISYQGVITLGKGFSVETEEAHRWIAADSTLAEVVRPYLGGKDLNSRSDFSASRYVIDFNDRPESEAAKYNLAFERVKVEVKPERQRKKTNGDYVLRKPLPERWWQYADKRPAMRRAIADLDRVIVIAQVSSTLMPALVKADQVLDAKLIVFALDDYASFATLSSDLHRFWILKYGTTMRTDATYTPSSVFLPFPRPESTPELEAVGRVLDEERSEIMLRRQLGLTKLYNLVNDPELPDAADPDVARLRQIHRELDAAVAAAYGWGDITLDHGFYTYKQITRYSISPAARVEILDRLLAENHRRAALEAEAAAQAAKDKPEATKKRREPKKKSTPVPPRQKESLF